ASRCILAAPRPIASASTRAPYSVSFSATHPRASTSSREAASSTRPRRRRPSLGRVEVDGGAHDPQAELRRLSPLFAQEEPEDGQAAQPRHVPDATRGRSARARGAVLQVARLTSVAMMRRRVAAALALVLCVAVAGCASSGSAPSITTTTPNGTFEQI